MKGYLAAALAAVPQLATAGLKRPIHLAFSYDEEAGCRGVPHLIARLPALCAPPLGAIIGEPSNMRPCLPTRVRPPRGYNPGAGRAFLAP